ncbi:hypothetical protein [Deinococcus aquatilis]|uniref:hypothetical protein n=1 Tax=Deinococcus aquatilis TaxID=519440 RepID=UPI0012FBE004|nr:hypothetical protein [Deinococcus aquatilis]
MSGNRQGQPAVYLHGSLSGAMGTGYRRRFDPDRFGGGKQHPGLGAEVMTD